ncbi:hypothetical protein Trydic_g15506 [Trypoxylus dichotomus]
MCMEAVKEMVSTFWKISVSYRNNLKSPYITTAKSQRDVTLFKEQASDSNGMHMVFRGTGITAKYMKKHAHQFGTVALVGRALSSASIKGAVTENSSTFPFPNRFTPDARCSDNSAGR